MEKAALEIFQPVMEGAVVLAAEYCKACKRSVVTSRDMEYGMKYSARYLTGKQVGSLFPEVYEDNGDEEDIEDCIETNEDDEEWTRYTGDESKFVAMNECFDTWDSWEPQTPSEQAIYNAIQSIN